MLGRFLEISIRTQDIRASVEFYERLGFAQCETGDTWQHPYGVLTDGRIFVGLHEHDIAAPSLTFAREAIASHLAEFEQVGLELEFARTGEETFNAIGFRDPTGHMVTVLEARTFSPAARRPQDTSHCGYFAEYSLPCSGFDAPREFWEKLGFVATQEMDQPYVYLPLTSDNLDLAFHAANTLNRPALVFRDSDMAERIQRLRMLDVISDGSLPRGLDSARNALIEAPEGTSLLLLHGD